MCTQARTPSPSRRKLSASSKSFASSGSIVKAKRSRRSTRSGSSSGRRRRQRRVLPAYALVPEEPFENRLDVARRAQDPLDPGAPPPQTNDDEVARRGVPGALAVDDDGDAALEVRLADEELAPAGKLADEQLGHYAAAEDLKKRPAGDLDRLVALRGDRIVDGDDRRVEPDAGDVGAGGREVLRGRELERAAVRGAARLSAPRPCRTCAARRGSRGPGRRERPPRSRPRSRFHRSRARRAAASAGSGSP